MALTEYWRARPDAGQGRRRRPPVCSASRSGGALDEPSDEAGPVRRRTTEHHHRRRYDAHGRVVEEHRAVRYLEDYARPAVSKEVRDLVLSSAALLLAFLSVVAAATHQGPWAGLATALAWALVMGPESIVVLPLYAGVAAILSVLMQSFWGAVVTVVPFAVILMNARPEEPEPGRNDR